MHVQSLAPPVPLSGARIAGTSAAIALHALVLMLLFTPATWAPPMPDVPNEQPVPIDFPLIKPVVVAPPPTPKPQPEHLTHNTQTTKPVIAQVVAVASDTGPQVTRTEVEPVDTDEGGSTSNVMSEISIADGPTPTYPPLALRAGTTGEVLLRIDVDANGHPISGEIAKSSGSRLLDQAALKFVLARWHFNPALRAGKAVAAVALVPISFTLD